MLLFLLFPNKAVFLCLEANNGLTLGLFRPPLDSELGGDAVVVGACVNDVVVLLTETEVEKEVP